MDARAAEQWPHPQRLSSMAAVHKDRCLGLPLNHRATLTDFVLKSAMVASWGSGLP